MPQKQDHIKPYVFLNMDTDFSELLPKESPYVKSIVWDINANPNNQIGTNNPTGEGQNLLAASTTRSNQEIPNVLLPKGGWNKNIGSFDSPTTDEAYHFNFNSTGQHGIYVINGNTEVWQTVIIDPELQFSDDQEAFMAAHRVTLRLVRNKVGEIIEKYLLITDGQSWQKYISVEAAIKTNGFDASLNPYWTLQPPHFDRRELLEWPVRPPLIRPEVSVIPNTANDKGKIGQLADRAFQVAIQNINTDGRISTLGLYSLPLIIKSSDYQNNIDNIPKNALFKLPAGSPLTEQIGIYIRKAEYDKNTFSNGSIVEWGDWYLYDTINKFKSSGNNAPQVIGNDYWKRTNPWADFNYNATFNTIEYVFDNSRVPAITSQDEANKIESGMPQLSVAMTDVGDAVLLGDNRYGYPNFSDETLKNLDVVVEEKGADGCNIPLRNLYFYAYIGRCGDDFSYCSQVGYTLGDDKKVRFGGLHVENISGANGDVKVELDETATFDLNFADKNALQLYLKGTQYSSVGEWYYVRLDNTLVKLDHIYDFSIKAEIDAAGGILAAGGYFVCRFHLQVPAGKYIATIGRHNVSLSGDYRGTSTYIYGIANSNLKSPDDNFITLKPFDAINPPNYSKEMEVDCTMGDVDVWGNGQDIFYIYCPYITRQGNQSFRFIEGYLREKPTTVIPVEMFPYQMTHAATDDCGRFTDKNGFYFAYTKVKNSDVVDIQFFTYLNCVPTNFIVVTAEGGIGWRRNPIAYLQNYNNNVLGGCNRVVVKGKITNLDATINYSNIAISIKDGNTVYTSSDGTFELIVHNGLVAKRISNMYVNAGGAFTITTSNCGNIPLFVFNENLVPCINCNDRIYPIPINLAIKIEYISQTSLKEGAKYSVICYGMDLAGRVMYANIIKSPIVPAFLQRNNTNATYFKVLLGGALHLQDYPDMKWLVFGASKNLTQKRFLDWVGDSIAYIDSNGNVVTDAASAVFCAITIDSLYNFNVANNFSVLANYQFTPGDRLRIYDNGENQLYNTTTFGDVIDIEIYGTNFNQALINAGLVPPPTNIVLTPATTTLNKSVTLIVPYDSRLTKVTGKTGFWIETYTPTKERDIIPFQDIISFPIINGEIAEYIGGGNVNPQYNYPTSIILDYWDTYFFQRVITIPNTGSKLFPHIFQSPNITDYFGKEITSGGRRNIENKQAKQLWFGGDTIKTKDFVNEGMFNGLSYFDSVNRKNFGTYPFGDIVAMRSERNIIWIGCQNDWFLVDYNYHYTYANEQGIMVTNLDNGLSTPHQKTKGKYGILKEDTGTVVISEDGIFWQDNKNTAFVKMDYRTAVDISQKNEEAGELGGVQSYLNTKIEFINNWNNTHGKNERFDCVAGIDQERGNVYLTFRNRRRNTNDLSSYINLRRGIDLKASETIVYSIQYHGWLRFENFAPEGYCKLKGKSANVEMLTFAAGVPYKHNNTPNNSFLKFYGQQCEPIISFVFNQDKEVVQLFQSLAHDSNPNGWFIDLMYTNFINSFSYLSKNQFKKKEGMFYAAILRNMNGYPSNDPADLFRSQLVDGYRMFGRYLVARMIGAYATLNQYNQLNNIYLLKSPSGNNKK